MTILWRKPQNHDISEAELSDFDGSSLLRHSNPTDLGYHFNRSRNTRIVCIVGTAVAWAFGLAVLISGSRWTATADFTAPNGDQFYHTTFGGVTLSHVFPLLLNIIITVILDITGFAHAT